MVSAWTAICASELTANECKAITPINPGFVAALVRARLKGNRLKLHDGLKIVSRALTSAATIAFEGFNFFVPPRHRSSTDAPLADCPPRNPRSPITGLSDRCDRKLFF